MHEEPRYYSKFILTKFGLKQQNLKMRVSLNSFGLVPRLPVFKRIWQQHSAISDPYICFSFSYILRWLKEISANNNKNNNNNNGFEFPWSNEISCLMMVILWFIVGKCLWVKWRSCCCFCLSKTETFIKVLPLFQSSSSPSELHPAKQMSTLQATDNAAPCVMKVHKDKVNKTRPKVKLTSTK